ncbi:hypothetical protein NDU88_009565 [Pleurodeles waltl]|uniref:Uncharacterized protein n=1 Tax=Pleurodeles waltl TaxID=8319 RepID=A0AAV7RXZ5_PLEWA|nr:hypothetical protein NDU88_009565 [Pleurodeles waltl]
MILDTPEPVVDSLSDFRLHSSSSGASSRAFSGSLPEVTEQEQLLLTILQTVHAQQEEARRYYAQARANSAVIQCCLTEVTSKVASLSPKITELQQRVTDLEDTEAVAGKSLDGPGHALSSLEFKLEDFENQQRLNNLWIFGILEGIYQYMMRVLGKSSPELSDWDWDSQIQGDHCLPIHRLDKSNAMAASISPGRTCAMLFFIGNFLLRQTIFIKVYPAAPVRVDSMTTLASSDLCKAPNGVLESAPVHRPIKTSWCSGLITKACMAQGCQEWPDAILSHIAGRCTVFVYLEGFK